MLEQHPKKHKIIIIITEYKILKGCHYLFTNGTRYQKLPKPTIKDVRELSILLQNQHSSQMCFNWLIKAILPCNLLERKDRNALQQLPLEP